MEPLLVVCVAMVYRQTRDEDINHGATSYQRSALRMGALISSEVSTLTGTILIANKGSRRLMLQVVFHFRGVAICLSISFEFGFRAYWLCAGFEVSFSSVILSSISNILTELNQLSFRRLDNLALAQSVFSFGRIVDASSPLLPRIQ